MLCRRLHLPTTKDTRRSMLAVNYAFISSKFLAVLVSILVLSTIVFLYHVNFTLNTSQLRTSHRLSSVQSEVSLDTSLGVADQIYVVSLPSRQDRRKDMEVLRRTLGLEWTYVDATQADSPLISKTLNWVEIIRTGTPRILNKDEASMLGNVVRFSWPDNIDEIAMSTQEIGLWDAESYADTWNTPSEMTLSLPYRPIRCATNDYDIALDITRPPPGHLILTSSRVACWHSHLTVIRQIANNNLTDGYGVGIILEDDIDMEKDIRQQMLALWRTLPTDWDVVFLGHCWSDESRGASLSPALSETETAHQSSSASRLHVSTRPKCTHAYALSRIGARRLLLHLRYPPFAYSRAIDQAFAWLVESGRLRSFSVVPALVVQRKVTESDVMAGKGSGSKWKDVLTNGVFNRNGQ